MQNIKNQAPQIVEAFRNLTNSIDSYSSVSHKTKELILLGIFTANKAIRGIDTHVRLAVQYGATENEIVSAILYAMPVVGVPSVTLALDKALEVINQIKNN